MAPPSARGHQPHQALRRAAPARSAGPRASCAPSTPSRFAIPAGATLGPRRRVGAAARRRRPSSSSRSRSRRRGAFASRGRDVATLRFARGEPRVPSLGPGRLPGPVRVARSAHARGDDRGRAARDQRRPRRRRPPAAGWPSCSTWSACPRRAGHALPARVLRRPAPAYRHRPARARAPRPSSSCSTSPSRRSTSRSAPRS